MSLFNALTVPNRHKTQLAYRIKYWPKHELSDAAKELICFSKKVYMSKAEIEEHCSEDKTVLSRQARDYAIVWAYNNVPTGEEWNKVANKRLIAVELRSSPAIDKFSVAILSFELPSERLAAHANGEFADC